MERAIGCNWDEECSFGARVGAASSITIYCGSIVPFGSTLLVTFTDEKRISNRVVVFLARASENTQHYT